MVDVKKLTNFLKSETEFLKDNDDYAGAYLKLDDTYSVVLSFEDGFYSGDNDVIHSKENPRFALVAAIRVTNPGDTPDMWEIPYDKKSGDLYLDDYTVSTNEDFEGLAQRLINDYEYMTKEIQPLLDREEEVEIEDEVEEACGSKLKESTEVKKTARKKVNEDFNDELLDGLVERAVMNYNYDEENGDIGEAVQEAIDEYLIYDDDIFALAGRYIDASEVLGLYYEELFDELYGAVKEELKEKGEVVESAEKNKKIVKKELKVTSELDDWDDIKPLDITDEDLKF